MISKLLTSRGLKKTQVLNELSAVASLGLLTLVSLKLLSSSVGTEKPINFLLLRLVNAVA